MTAMPPEEDLVQPADHSVPPRLRQEGEADFSRPAPPTAPRTLGELQRTAIGRLRAAGIDSAPLDARLLIGHALGLERETLFAYPERPLNGEDCCAADMLIERRIAREPVSRILGRREFWSLNFALSPAVLDPRPDSETLIEAVLAACPDRDRPWRILDLGTGSGCLLLALLSEFPAATGLGLDRSPEAVAIAAVNARALGLAARARLIFADWSESLDHLAGESGFEIVISNPPYIPDREIAALEPEVARFDPPGALAGGDDGLEAYRRLAVLTPTLLAPGGIGVFEVGCGQAAAVAALFRAAGLTVPAIRRDLAGIERCVIVAGER
jgi:release factor glutamine methyltransferase